MNKTVIINIGNSILHIEEDAYELLMNYLNEIKQYFARSVDDFEIVKDIENRVAEMLLDCLQKGQKAAIDQSDVQRVISQMGKVQDFVEEGAELNFESNQQIFITAKRLYRDTNRAVIAGVCSGFSHYVNVKVAWVRLFFILLFFLFGAGFLAYLIAWIVIPKAKTRSQKMTMRGEPENLYAYQKSLDEELLQQQNFSNQPKQNYSIVRLIARVVEATFAAISKLLSGIVRLLAKLFAIFTVGVGFICLVALIILLGVFLGVWDDGLYHTFPFSLANVTHRTELVFAAFFTAFIPILGLVIAALKLLTSHIQVNKYFSFSLLGVWIIAAIVTSFNVARIAAGFNEDAEIAKTTVLKPYKKLVIKVDTTAPFTRADSLDYGLDNSSNGYKVVLDGEQDGLFGNPKNVRLIFEPSEDNRITLVQSFKSSGKNFKEALANAQNISYSYQQRDSVFTLTPRAHLIKNAAWREQEVIFKLKIPVGTQVTLHEDVEEFVKFFNYCNQYINNRDEVVWIMTSEGLRCKEDLDKTRDAKP